MTQVWSAEDVLVGAGAGRDGDGDQDWAGVYARVQMLACHSVLLLFTSIALANEGKFVLVYSCAPR